MARGYTVAELCVVIAIALTVVGCTLRYVLAGREVANKQVDDLRHQLDAAVMYAADWEGPRPGIELR